MGKSCRNHSLKSQSMPRIMRSRYTTAHSIHVVRGTTCFSEKLTITQGSSFLKTVGSHLSESKVPISTKSFYQLMGLISRYTQLERITPMLKPESARLSMVLSRETSMEKRLGTQSTLLRKKNKSAGQFRELSNKMSVALTCLGLKANLMSVM